MALLGNLPGVLLGKMYQHSESRITFVWYFKRYNWSLHGLQVFNGKEHCFRWAAAHRLDPGTIHRLLSPWDWTQAERFVGLWHLTHKAPWEYFEQQRSTVPLSVSCSHGVRSLHQNTLASSAWCFIEVFKLQYNRTSSAASLSGKQSLLKEEESRKV